MGTCRISDLIPRVLLKRINIYEKSSSGVADIDSGAVNPHIDNIKVQANTNFKVNYQSADNSGNMIQYQIHMCAMDTIVNPNVDYALKEKTIVQDGVSQVVNIEEQGPLDPSRHSGESYASQLPQDMIGTMMEDTVSYSQYFMNKQFTDMFRVHVWYVTHSGLIRLIEKINSIRPLGDPSNRMLGRGMATLMRALDTGFIPVGLPNFGAPINGTTLRVMLESIGLTASEVAELNNEIVGLNNLANIGTYINPQVITFKNYGTIKDMLEEGSVAYDIDGNLSYEILPKEFSGPNDSMPFLEFQDTDLKRKDAAFLFWPCIMPSDSSSADFADLTGIDLDAILASYGTMEKYRALADMFSGNAVYQRVLQNNKSIGVRYVDPPFAAMGEYGADSQQAWSSELIQDFRIIERLKKIDVEFYNQEGKPLWEAFLTETLEPSAQSVSLEEALNLEGAWYDKNLVSELYSSFSMPDIHSLAGPQIERKGRSVINYFYFNFGQFLRQKSILSNLYKNLEKLVHPLMYGNPVLPDTTARNMYDEILNKSKITEMRIYRKRVRNAGNRTESSRLVFSGHHGHDKNDKERLLCYTSQDMLTSLSVSSNEFKDSDGNPISSISEIGGPWLSNTQEIHFGSGNFTTTGFSLKEHKRIRSFCFTDTEVVNKNTGLYAYSVEFDIFDVLPKHVTNLCVGPGVSIEKLIFAYDHLINYIEQNTKNTSVYGNGPSSGLVEKLATTNYHWLTDSISSNVLNSPEYNNLAMAILQQHEAFKKLFILFTGIHWTTLNNNDLFRLPNFAAGETFESLRLLKARRDLVKTFYNRVAGVMGFSGVGRLKPLNIRHGSTFNGTEGRFSPHNKVLSLRYDFKDYVNIDKLDGLTYDIFGTAIDTDETLQEIAFNNNLGPTIVDAEKYAKRLEMEYRKLNDHWAAFFPPMYIPKAKSLKFLGAAGIVDRVGSKYFPWKDIRVNINSANKFMSGQYGASVPKIYKRVRQMTEMLMSEITGIDNIKIDWPMSTNSLDEISPNNPANPLYKQRWFTEFLAQSTAGTTSCVDPTASVLSDKLIDKDVLDKKVCEMPSEFIHLPNTSWNPDNVFPDDDDGGPSPIRPEEEGNQESCDHLANYLISRIITYLGGYDFFDRDSFVQGTRVGRRFDPAAFKDYANTLRNLVDAGLIDAAWTTYAPDLKVPLIPFEWFDRGDFDLIEQELNFVLQNIFRINAFKIYALEYLSIWDVDSMSSKWRQFNYNTVKLNSKNVYFCRLRLYEHQGQAGVSNTTFSGVPNANATNFEIYDRYFLLCSKLRANGIKLQSWNSITISKDDNPSDPHTGG